MDLISVLIIILGAAVLAALIRYSLRFKEILLAFDRIEEKENSYHERLDRSGNVSARAEQKVSYDRKKLEENREAYNRLYSRYVVASQLISLFPLLGIFGTVLGLVTSNLADIDSLVAGLSQALWTTFWGLVCAIALKAVDAVLPGRLVNDIDARFDAVDGAIERLSLEAIIKEAQ